jgi:hypothetical protein
MRPTLIDRCPHCSMPIRQRSGEQNDALHAKISDIAHQLEWPANSGQRLTVEQWKRLLIAAWDRSQGSSADFFPALDGHGFDVVYRRSSRLSKQDASELLEYVTAWGTDQGVKWERTEADG